MSLAALTAAAALLAGPAPQTFPTPPQVLPAPATAGQCRPDPGSAATPEAVARRFDEVAFRQDRAAMAALITPGSAFTNAHDDARMSDEDFLAILGVGRAGRTEILETLTSGATAVLREQTAYGGEILMVVQTDGGCVTGVTSFYD